MMRPNHAYQRACYSPDAYLNSRVARPDHFREAVRCITDEIEDEEDVRILVLGCNYGENDLLPLVEILREHKTGSCEVAAIDDSGDAVEGAVERLRAKGITLEEVQPDRMWKSNDDDVRITLLEEDIEVYPPEIFEARYDVILSFFVFNHLTNWQLCVQKLCETLDAGGKLFVTQYDDPVTRGLENNPKPEGEADDLMSLFYQYHECRLERYGIAYLNSFLGTRIESLKESLVGKFDYELAREIEYEVQTSEEDVIRRLGPASLHTPIHWGHVRDENRDDENDKFKECIPGSRSANGSLASYSGTLSLHRFTKNEDDCSLHPYVWDSNLRSVLQELDNKIEVYEDEQDEDRVEKRLMFLMQLILGYQGLGRCTQFLTPLFWKVATHQDEVAIDLDSFLTWRSLITSRNLNEVFSKYLNHLLLFRSHDVGDGQEEKERYSLSEVIFSRSETDVNWIFAPTDEEFSCEVIRNGTLRFFIIRIPEKYRNDDREVEEAIFERGEERNRFSNFVCYDLNSEAKLENSTKEHRARWEQWEQEIFNRDAIESESDLRVEKILRSLENPIWSHLPDKKKSGLASTLARRVPRFAYLVELGPCIYITNKLYDDEDGGASGNGGLFFCEEGIEVEDLRDQSSFLYQRYKLLEDVVNAYSRKTVLPQVESARRKGQWKEVGIKTLHNINAEIASAKRSVETYKSESASDLQKENANLQKAITILGGLHEKSQSIFTFQKRKETGRKDFIVIEKLSEHLSEEVEVILRGIQYNDKIANERRRGFLNCLEKESFRNWIQVEGEEVPVRVEKSFKSGLQEILKNCIENTDPSFGTPIKVVYDGDETRLVIKNSMPIPEKILSFVREYPRRSSEGLDIAFGLVISLDIMDYCDVECEVKVTEDENTLTTLRIPKRGE